MASQATSTSMRRVPQDGQRPIPHGTLNGYVNYRCSCDECKAAKATYERGQREKARIARAAASPLRRVRGNYRVVR